MHPVEVFFSVGFPDGQSALMLVAARLRHIAGSRWGERRYLKVERLEEASLVAAETQEA